MAEISTLPPSSLSADFSALKGREERGRKIENDAPSFGDMVSAQARTSQEVPKSSEPPRSQPAAPEQLASKSAMREKPRAADQDDRRVIPEDQKEAPPADPRMQAIAASNSETPACRDHSEADKPSCDIAIPEEVPVEVSAEMAELPAGVSAEPVELPAGVSAEPVELPAGVSAQPAETPAGLFIGPAETPVANAVSTAAISKGDPEAEAVIAALGAVSSEGRAAKAASTVSTASLETADMTSTAEAPAASSADAFGKLTTKTPETPVAGRSAGGEAPVKAPAAADLPKANFADWINDFAVAQGAVHRSGDLVGSLDRALSALPTPHAGQDALRPTPLQMLPIEIGMQAVRGVSKFQIRLDPPELGRVDVRLEFKEDGQVKANLVVDRVETLAMLKRDAHTLQQAFEQAGLRQSPDDLQFSLRGEGQQREGQREGDQRRAWSSEDEKLMGEMPPEIAMRRVMIPNSSLDLMV